jgi:hypothetical protein
MGAQFDQNKKIGSTMVKAVFDDLVFRNNFYDTKNAQLVTNYFLVLIS